MTLVQIDLQRGPARKHPPGYADAAEGDHAAAHRATTTTTTTTTTSADPIAAAEATIPRGSLAPAAAGLVLAGGLVLLAPVAVAATGSRPSLLLLLAALAALGLFAALLRPALPGVDRS